MKMITAQKARENAEQFSNKSPLKDIFEDIKKKSKAGLFETTTYVPLQELQLGVFRSLLFGVVYDSNLNCTKITW